MRHSQTPLDTGSGSNSPPIAHRGTAGRDYAYGYRYELRRRDTACRHWREERALASWDWVDLGAFAGSKKLEQVWLALRRHYDVHVAGTPRAADQIDLQLQRSATVNAYAAGGRSVAVSSGALREFLARRLSGDRMRAVLVHELGHHSTGGTRFSLVVLWLAMPWRAASRLVLVLCYGLAGRRQPLALLGIVVLAAVGIAVGKAVQHGQWAAAAVLSGLIVCAVVCPIADAYVARRSEFAADRFAAARGAGPELASALLQLGGGERRIRGVARLLSRHPSLERRVAALAG